MTDNLFFNLVAKHRQQVMTDKEFRQLEDAVCSDEIYLDLFLMCTDDLYPTRVESIISVTKRKKRK